MKRKCCQIVYFKHDMGWDVYERSECQQFGNAWIPRFFDNPLAEDLLTKKQAMQEIEEMHVLGICLVRL